MVPASTRHDRSPALSGAHHGSASATAAKAPTGPFGTLPTEVIGRIFYHIPIEATACNDFHTRVCTSFAAVSRPHRLAASLYAGADLEQGQPSSDERVARVEQTLAGLVEHAGLIADDHKAAILDRLINQLYLLEGRQSVEVWGKLCEAHVHLAKADQPDFILKCLGNPASDSGILMQPDKILHYFRVFMVVSSGAPAQKAKILLGHLVQSTLSLPESIHLQAFTELLAACAGLHAESRMDMLVDMTKQIRWLDESRRAEAVDAVLLLLPRLQADDVAPVLKSLFGQLDFLSNQLKAKCLDAGILLFSRLGGNAKYEVLNALVLPVGTLPAAVRNRYEPTVLGCCLSLPAEHQDWFASWLPNG